MKFPSNEITNFASKFSENGSRPIFIGRADTKIYLYFLAAYGGIKCEIEITIK